MQSGRRLTRSQVSRDAFLRSERLLSRSKNQKQQQLLVKKQNQKAQSVTTINSEDPILLEPLTGLSKKMIIHLSRPNGCLVAYNIKSLVSYMTASGDLSDPVTRIPFTDEQLFLIDSKAKSVDLPSSFVSMRKEGSSSKKAMEDMKFRRNALCGIERLAGDCIASILKHCENEDLDFMSLQSEILLNELPAFNDYFTQLRDEDDVYASQCMKHWISYLKGPPNRPNEDQNDMISLVCAYLEEL